MKKRYLIYGLFILLFLTTACSSSSDDSAKTEAGQSSISNYAKENSDGNEEANYNDNVSDTEAVENLSDQNKTNTSQSNRMIIHRANIGVKVKNLEESQEKIEKRTEKYGGYIVEANVYRENDERSSGYMTIRVPEKHFQTFLTDTEKDVADVIERNVSGQDITEEYIDLESRLKSKRVVEERLLAFMKEAKKTEDLLTISSDLASIQEEIEVITGKMNYYDNQVAYATIEISMFESGVNIPELENKNLDTWEKTKKQLATSVNFILSAGSGIFIFIVGNLPILLILLILGTIIYILINKQRSK